jgi:hypothetical protein
MKIEDVPQDPTKTYGGARKLLYAVDERGEYAGVQSAGWEVEAYVNSAAVEALNKLRDEAWTRARAGQASALEYHMYRRRMEPATLAAATRLWPWRVKRHLSAQGFARLSDKLLLRYAQALNLSVQDLRALPERPDP